MSERACYDSIRDRFVSWAVGVLEDDYVPYGIDEIVLYMENRYPRVSLSMRFYEQGVYTVFYPLEGQFFFDAEFVNLDITDEEATQLLIHLAEGLCNNDEYVQYAQGTTLKVQLNGKKVDFLKTIASKRLG